MIDWAHLNWVDWFILVVLTASILLSLWRGFAREAISLAAWVAAFVVANMFVDQLASVLASWIDNVTGRYIAAYALLFVGTLMLGGVLGILVAQLMKVTGYVAAVDTRRFSAARLLGLVRADNLNY